MELPGAARLVEQSQAWLLSQEPRFSKWKLPQLVRRSRAFVINADKYADHCRI
jgi:hypothetical protein